MRVDDARLLVANTDRVTKFALPSPFLIAIRKWHEDYSKDAYPTREHFMEPLAERLHPTVAKRRLGEDLPRRPDDSDVADAGSLR